MTEPRLVKTSLSILPPGKIHKRFNPWSPAQHTEAPTNSGSMFSSKIQFLESAYHRHNLIQGLSLTCGYLKL